MKIASVLACLALGFSSAVRADLGVSANGGSPGSIPLTSLAPQAAGTGVGNCTGSSSSPTAAYSCGPQVFNPRNYGAICDGNSHPLSGTYATLAAAQAVFPAAISLTQEFDDAAINYAVNLLRALNFNGQIAGSVVLPRGMCVINYGVNLTGLKNENNVIDGSGTILLGETGSSYAVVDALNSSFLTIRDLVILGNSTNSPRIGLQIGRNDTTANTQADENTIDNVRTFGQFSLAGYVNLNSETTLQNKLYITNSYNAAGVYAAIFDGINHFSSASRFTTQNQPANTNESFNENVCVSCSFVNSGASVTGAAVWISNTNRHTWIGAYVLNNYGPYGVENYILSGSQVNYGPAFDLHIEGTALTDAFYIDGAGTGSPSWYGFKFYEQGPSFSNSVIKDSGQYTSYNMYMMDVQVGYGSFSKLFNTTTIFYSGGTLRFQASQSINTGCCYEGEEWVGANHTTQGTYQLTGQTQFTGSVVVGSEATSPPLGNGTVDADGMYVQQKAVITETRTPMSWGTGNVVANTTTYISPGFTQGSNPATAGLAPINGTLKNFYIATQNTPGTGSTFTATIYSGTPGLSGPTASAITCQITASATSCNDTTHTLAITAGQAWTVQLVTSASSGTTGAVNIGVEYDNP